MAVGALAGSGLVAGHVRALGVAVLAIGVVCVVSIGGGRDELARDRTAATSPASGVVGPAVAVGNPGYGITGLALGEGSVWVGTWERAGGVVLRLDPRSGEPVATMRVPHGGGDVAVGSGAVWTAGVVCLARHPDDPEDVCVTEPRVSRIDPDTGRVQTTIPIPLPPGVGRDTRLPSGVAAGQDAVWVAVSWNHSTGEVLRIDPRTNAIAARIPTGGYVGELRLGAGSVWVLSHPQYTDETRVKGRLTASHRRVHQRGRRDSHPRRAVRSGRGGDPARDGGGRRRGMDYLTAAHSRRAVGVDTQTNTVAREQLRVERFYPVAVEEDAIWFIGSTGRGATLARLDPRTLEHTAATKLPISAVRAVHDPATDSFWIASLVNRYNERAQVVRLQMRLSQRRKARATASCRASNALAAVEPCHPRRSSTPSSHLDSARRRSLGRGQKPRLGADACFPTGSVRLAPARSLSRWTSWRRPPPRDGPPKRCCVCGGAVVSWLPEGVLSARPDDGRGHHRRDAPRHARLPGRQPRG